MKYAMLICGAESNWFDNTPEATDGAYQAIFAWMEKWQAAGKLVDNGAELDTVRKAKTIARGADGQPVVMDGPYVELKEVIGGFFILTADDMDEAVAIAAGWPCIALFGDKVEVRPLVQR